MFRADLWDWITYGGVSSLEKTNSPSLSNYQLPVALHLGMESCEISLYMLVCLLVVSFFLGLVIFLLLKKIYFFVLYILIIISPPVTPPTILPFCKPCLGNSIIESFWMRLPCRVEDTTSKKVLWLLQSFCPLLWCSLSLRCRGGVL